MNVYILVEGEETELTVYPEWIKHINPNLKRIYFASDAKDNNYYIISGKGIPSIYKHVINSIKDINDFQNYDLLIVSLDSEDYNLLKRKNELLDYIKDEGVELNKNCKLEIIVQNVCIETWFLGNKKIVKPNPQSQLLNSFLSFYNVRDQDPEEMGKLDGHKNKAHFHLSYFKEILKEKNLSYSKNRPKHVQELKFFNELLKRSEKTNHISSFKYFYKIIESTK